MLLTAAVLIITGVLIKDAIDIHTSRIQLAIIEAELS